jgi:tetratricopeptide (TPR) repeat protein
MAGRYETAITAARRLVKAMDAPNMAAKYPFMEFYAFTPVVTLVRFEKWDAVLAEPPPPKTLVLDRAVDLYAKGTAHAAKGELAQAQDARDLLSSVIAVSDFSRFDESAPAKAVASLALDLLDGEIARAKGDTAGAVMHFRAAYQRQLALPYSEPPFWHQPVSHVLGAALLVDHRPAEAEAVYREGLKVYRDDGWALFGLAQALDAQGKRDEAAAVREKFASAWARADVKLASSRSPA